MNHAIEDNSVNQDARSCKVSDFIHEKAEVDKYVWYVQIVL